MSQHFERWFMPWVELLGVSIPPRERATREDRPFRIGTYLVMGSITVGLAFSVCSGLVRLSDSERVAAMEVYLYGFAVAWMAGTLTLSRWRPSFFVKAAVGIAVAALPAALMASQISRGHEPVLAFWAGLGMWSVVATYAVWGGAKGLWDRTLLVLGTVWLVATVITFVGTLEWFPYARTAIRRARAVHVLLDTRILLTVMFSAALLVTASHRALAHRFTAPRIARRYFTDERAEQDSQTFLERLVVLANAALEVVYAVGDVLVALIAIPALYFVRVGEEGVSLVRTMLRDLRVIRSSATIAGTFLLLLVLLFTAARSSRSAVQYLMANEFLNALRWFGPLLVNSAFGAICVAFLAWLFENDKTDVVEWTFRALMLLLSMFLLTAVLMLVSARVAPLAMVGFNHPGPFSVIVLSFIVVGVGYWVLRSLSASRTFS